MSNKEEQFLKINRQVQEKYVGEFLGRTIEAETNLHLVAFELKEAKERITELENFEEKYKLLKEQLEASDTNKLAFEEQNNELLQKLKEARAGRQKAEEEVAKLKETKKKISKPKLEVVNGKYDKNKAEQHSQ